MRAYVCVVIRFNFVDGGIEVNPQIQKLEPTKSYSCTFRLGVGCECSFGIKIADASLSEVAIKTVGLCVCVFKRKLLLLYFTMGAYR